MLHSVEKWLLTGSHSDCNQLRSWVQTFLHPTVSNKANSYSWQEFAKKRTWPTTFFSLLTPKHSNSLSSQHLLAFFYKPRKCMSKRKFLSHWFFLLPASFSNVQTLSNPRLASRSLFKIHGSLGIFPYHAPWGKQGQTTSYPKSLVLLVRQWSLRPRSQSAVFQQCCILMWEYLLILNFFFSVATLLFSLLHNASVLHQS